MSVEVKVPHLPESVADATVSNWYKQAGDYVERDENLVDIETDKVMLEVPSPVSGVIKSILHPEGATVLAEQVLAEIEQADKPAQAAEKAPAAAAAPAATTSAVEGLSPAVRRLVAEHDVDLTLIKGTGKDGKITKKDVEAHLKAPKPAAAKPQPETAPAPVGELGERTEKRVPMSRLRARIAERLVQAQHDAAMLTTFNEVDLHQVVRLRSQFKEQFEKTHQVRLGFMSFFIKAAIEALKRFPAVNSSIDGNEIIYHGYFDIGVAVSTERGLVVPVLRDADQMNMATMEKTIGDYAKRARDNKLTIEEMTGGTFTITNGGVFGSLLSTPIINPPQVAILGMHKIEERPVVVNGEIEVRPMMYLAMSYDHRIIDGRESVQFLKAIKEYLEYPARMILDV